MEQVKINVSHGSKKYEISLGSSREKKATLEDLANAIAAKCGIPKNKQKLICKGKTLNGYNSTLADLGITSKSKVMVLGRKNDPVEDKYLSDIEKVTKQTELLQKGFEDLQQEIASISRGFLDDEKTVESYKKLSLNLKGVAEGFMKNLETLDAIMIDSEYTSAKSKRKSQIKKISELLTAADKEIEKLDDILAAKL